MLDETYNALGHYVLNVLVGVLNGEKQKTFLLSIDFLDKTNSATVLQATLRSLNKIWAEIYFENVILLVTDQAPYMIKVGKS